MTPPGESSYQTSSEQTDRESPSPSLLAGEASRALGAVCESMAGLLETLPEPVARAVDLARMLKVHPPLAWQAFKMAGTTEPLAAVKYLPTSNQLSRLVHAAEDVGANPELVERTRQAIRQLDDFMAAHARDRREFESLLGSLSRELGGAEGGAAGGGASQIDLRHRRSLFRSNAHVWGIQARAGYAAMIIREDVHGAGTTVMMGGYVGLHVLRADVPMTCAVRTGVRSPSETDSGGPSPAPLAAMGVTRLIPPLPPVPGAASSMGLDRAVRLTSSGLEDGESVSMIRFPGIGRRAAVSFFLEQGYESARSGAAQKGHSLTSQSRVPSETLLLDLLVPAAAGGGGVEFGNPRVTTYGRRQGVDKVWERRAIDILPASEQATTSRGVTDVPISPDIPRLPEVIRWVLKDRGWYGERFDVFRCRVEYPILHTLVCMNVERIKTPPAG
jgi:hypothetical protein